MCETLPPETGAVFDRLLKRCHNCMHLRIHLEHTHPPCMDDKLSWWLALDNLKHVRCRKGRIRYAKDNKEKIFTSKHVLRVMPKLDSECENYEPDE